MMKEPTNELSTEESFSASNIEMATQVAFWRMTKDLQTAMTRDFICVDVQRNPLAINLNQLEVMQLKQAASFYSRFPAKIVDLLKGARDIARANNWSSVDVELTRNIGEELGTESPKSHFEHLVSGVQDALGFNVENPSLGASTSTDLFLMQINEITSDTERPIRVLGGIYAAECSAIKELLIVKALLNRISQDHIGADLDEDSELGQFLASHINDWEVGHENNLALAASEYITTQEARAEFTDGFYAVLKSMDVWWSGIYSEIIG